MSTLRPVVDHLWQQLGLAAPLDAIDRTFSFEIGDAPVELRLEANGDTVTVRADLGTLDPNPHQASDELRRLMRLGLALSAVNDAVLDVPFADRLLDDEAHQEVQAFAVSVARASDLSSVYPALENVVNWHGFAAEILSGTPTPQAVQSPASSAQDYENMIIFQP